jgi:hypothetical protein
MAARIPLVYSGRLTIVVSPGDRSRRPRLHRFLRGLQSGDVRREHGHRGSGVGKRWLFVIEMTTCFAMVRSSVTDLGSFRVALTFFTILASGTMVLHSPFFGTTQRSDDLGTRFVREMLTSRGFASRFFRAESFRGRTFDRTRGFFDMKWVIASRHFGSLSFPMRLFESSRLPIEAKCRGLCRTCGPFDSECGAIDPPCALFEATRPTTRRKCGEMRSQRRL